MNNYLLDTHVLIWLFFNTKKVPTTTIDLLSDNTNNLFVSAISLLEISIKYELGKLNLGNHKPNEVIDLCNAHTIQLINLNPNDAATLFQLNGNHHKDPFDRILIWQAIQNNYVLVTDDKNIKRYKSEGLKVIW